MRASITIAVTGGDREMLWNFLDSIERYSDVGDGPHHDDILIASVEKHVDEDD